MDQQKFINKYVELLLSNLTETIKKNILLEAQLNVTIEDSVSHETLKSQDENAKQTISKLSDRISELERENAALRTETQNNQVFKNELVSARSEINRLHNVFAEEKRKLEQKILELEIQLTNLKEESKPVPPIKPTSAKTNPISPKKTKDDF